MPSVSKKTQSGPSKAGPLRTAGAGLQVTRRAIRRHWSMQEKLRRREMAELMQRRLLQALGRGLAPG